ncbi:hypothetical protein AMJ85_11505 [candidate division BRC1 bacterium SM23_51]|nr:MAG: hypothetical protein AMJ85_11505 [candidate division BRC1 bacterium SM23_51]
MMGRRIRRVTEHVGLRVGDMLRLARGGRVMHFGDQLKRVRTLAVLGVLALALATESPAQEWKAPFEDSGQNLSSSESNGVALGDLDSDGDLDAFVANYDGADKVWLNDGHGAFNDSGQALGGGSPSGFVALGDVDGDGDLDAIVTIYNGATDRLWLNDGTGTFTLEPSFGGWHSAAVGLGDVDGDGDLDAVIANGYGTEANRLWLNDRTGTFTMTGQSLGVTVSLSIAFGDVDGDGDLDAFFGNSGANRIDEFLRSRPDEFPLHPRDGDVQ